MNQKVTSSRCAGLITPHWFAPNEETAETNTMQGLTPVFGDVASYDNWVSQIRELVLAEHYAAYKALSDAGVHMDVFKGMLENAPDHIYPDTIITMRGSDINNPELNLDPDAWYSIDCPMFHKNRQPERDIYLAHLVNDLGYKVLHVFDEDVTYYETIGKALEASGAIVMDRKNNRAYCAISDRADLDLFRQFCNKIGYKPIAYHTKDKLYHADVALSIGEDRVIWCKDIILNERTDEPDVYTADEVEAFLKEDREVFAFREEHVSALIGNIRELINDKNEKILFMSTEAYEIYQEEYPEILAGLARLSEKIVHVSLHNVHRNGGSACCIIQELFGYENAQKPAPEYTPALWTPARAKQPSPASLHV